MTSSFNPRAVVRSAYIKAAAALRMDELALGLQRWLIRVKRPPRMLVVEMHETPEKDALLFRQQLEWAERHFTLVDLSTFASLWSEYRSNPSAAKKAKPALLFTFDDGRQNNYHVAARLLESFGTRGVFFVVPKFVQCSRQEARQFYYSRIDTRQVAPDLPEEDTCSMTPDQIADLVRRGHSVGNHTYSHVNLASLSEAELHREIVESADQITSWSQKPVEAFAWTFSWDSITPKAWNLIQRHHRFCFAPCPGSVDCYADSPNLIWRTEVEAAYPIPDFRFMYAGLVNPLWRKQRQRLKATLSRPSGR